MITLGSAEIIEEIANTVHIKKKKKVPETECFKLIIPTKKCKDSNCTGSKSKSVATLVCCIKGNSLLNI